MMDVHLCMRRNDEAISALIRGEENKAIALLTTTLQEEVYKESPFYSPELSSFARSHEKNLCVDQPCKENYPLQHIRESAASMVEAMSVELSSLPVFHSSATIEIYNFAFKIAQWHAKPIYVSTVLRYNIGTALHRTGLCSGKSEYLHHALFFYRQAHKTMETIDVRDWPMLIAVAAAVYHNSSHICSVLFQMDDARYLQTRLLNVLEWPGSTYVIDEKSHLFFQMNLFHALSENFRLSPAA